MIIVLCMPCLFFEDIIFSIKALKSQNFLKNQNFFCISCSKLKGLSNCILFVFDRELSSRSLRSLCCCCCSWPDSNFFDFGLKYGLILPMGQYGPQIYHIGPPWAPHGPSWALMSLWALISHWANIPMGQYPHGSIYS